MNPKIKRILAWAGILLLLAMYAITLVFSLMLKRRDDGGASDDK